jgi:hypothetical protein
MELAVVKTQSQKCCAEAVQVLREVTEKVQSGEIETLMVIGIRPDGKFWTKASPSMSSLQSVGALEFLKYDLIVGA